MIFPTVEPVLVYPTKYYTEVSPLYFRMRKFVKVADRYLREERFEDAFCLAMRAIFEVKDWRGTEGWLLINESHREWCWWALLDRFRLAFTELGGEEGSEVIRWKFLWDEVEGERLEGELCV